MKNLLKIVALVLIALCGFISYGVGRSGKLKDLQIVKSVIIKGSKKEVFEMVQYLNNFPKWSPFKAQDPSQKVEVKGTDGTVGAQYHWVGNGGEDVGYQEIVKIDTFSFIGMKCDIQKPFVAKPSFDYTFEETPEGIKVTQDFKVKSNTTDAFFMWLFEAEKDMANTNQQGLALLKKLIEK
jgi:hypothetical protein